MNPLDSIATSASKLANEGVPIEIRIPVSSGLVLAAALAIPIVIFGLVWAALKKQS